VLALLLPHRDSDEELLTALCRGLFAVEGDGRVDDLRLGRAAALLLADLPAMSRWQLRGDLRALQLAVILTIGARLTAASPDEARAVLQHLRGTPKAAALCRVQSLCALACYGHPNLLAELGYAGPPP
jgi:hypothetical protein